MSAKLDTLDSATSWASPTDAEIRDWEALPRDEQIERLRAHFGSPECNTMSARSFSEIVAAARLKARSERNG